MNHAAMARLDWEESMDNLIFIEDLVGRQNQGGHVPLLSAGTEGRSAPAY